ncbi:MAG: hypothetical protein ACJA05_002111, partial [Porticoccus sp.]
ATPIGKRVNLGLRLCLTDFGIGEGLGCTGHFSSTALVDKLMVLQWVLLKKLD